MPHRRNREDSISILKNLGLILDFTFYGECNLVAQAEPRGTRQGLTWATSVA